MNRGHCCTCFCCSATSHPFRHHHFCDMHSNRECLDHYREEYTRETREAVREYMDRQKFTIVLDEGSENYVRRVVREELKNLLAELSK